MNEQSLQNQTILPTHKHLHVLYIGGTQTKNITGYQVENTFPPPNTTT